MSAFEDSPGRQRIKVILQLTDIQPVIHVNNIETIIFFSYKTLS